MKYEIVRLEEKIAVGVSARTNNMSPDMGAVFGGLWNLGLPPCEICCTWRYGPGSCRSMAGDLADGFAQNFPM